MKCKYKKLLLTNPDGTEVYTCCCPDAPCFGRPPECEGCRKKRKEEKK